MISPDRKLEIVDVPDSNASEATPSDSRSRMRRVALRAFWSGIDAATNPLSILLLTAGLVRFLGVADYGIFVVAFAVSNLALATNIAITTTTMKLVAESRGEADAGMHMLGRRIAALLVVVIVLSAAFLLIGVVFRHGIGSVMLGPELMKSRPDAVAILVVAILTVCIQQVDGVLAAILKGLEQFRVQSLLELASRALLTGVLVFAAWLTGQTLMVVILYALVLCISAVMRMVAVQRVTRLRLSRLKPTRAEFKEIFSFGAWMWVFAMAALLNSNLDKIMIGRFLGPKELGEYNVYLQLSQLVQFVPAGLFAFAMPTFSRLNAQQRFADIESAFWKLTLAVIAVSITIAIGLGVLFDIAIAALGGNALGHPEAAIKFSLITAFGLSASTLPPMFLLMALGESRRLSLINSVCAVAMLVAAMAFIPQWGMHGAVAARLTYSLGSLCIYVFAIKLLRSQSASSPSFATRLART